MATPLTPAAAEACLRAVITDFQALPGYAKRNRNEGRTFGPVHGVMIHHTVTVSEGGTVALVRDGRSDLPGPLYNVLVADDGTTYLIGWGRANHAGLGDSRVLAAVIPERMPYPKPRNAFGGKAGDTDGNARFYGIAGVNEGNGRDGWPEVQLDNMARAAAAICRRHGWSERSVIGHKEWTYQKPDPTFDMNAFRARVARYL